jgi:hypothetical protein
MIYEYLVNNIDNGEINGVLMLDFSSRKYRVLIFTTAILSSQ